MRFSAPNPVLRRARRGVGVAAIFAFVVWTSTSGCVRNSTWAGWNACGARDGFACSASSCDDASPPPTWDDVKPIAFDEYAQGEYIGPSRPAHVPEYRLRPDDVLEIVYQLKGQMTDQPYLLNVGDLVRIESATAPSLDREALVQPDGTIALGQLGQIHAAGRGLQQVREDVEEKCLSFITDPAITVTPLRLNSRLEEFRSAIDSRSGTHGQGRQWKVTPEGTIRLPAIGTVSAQNLTLTELKQEIDHRYEAVLPGLEVTAILVSRAPRSIYVLGEVKQAGRFALSGPTSVIQALALAGGWNPGACLTEVVVLRQDENWAMMATKVNIRGALYNKTPCPDEIWLRDSDVVIVPKSPAQVSDDYIDLVFTKGIYGVIPTRYSFYIFQQLSSF